MSFKMDTKALVNTDGAPTQNDYFNKERTILKVVGICIGQNVSVVFEKTVFSLTILTMLIYTVFAIMETTKHEFNVVGSFLVYLFAFPIGKYINNIISPTDWFIKMFTHFQNT